MVATRRARQELVAARSVDRNQKFAPFEPKLAGNNG